MRPLRIMVIGPYSATSIFERYLNVSAASAAGRELLVLGHVPLVPHSMTANWEEDSRLAYADFLRLTCSWLAVCDAVLYLGASPGADWELAEAERLCLRVFRCIKEVPAMTHPEGD